MSIYELDIEDPSNADALANALDECASDGNFSNQAQVFLKSCASIIRAQIPVPVPQKVGAVVKTDQGVFLRWTYDAHSINPWIMASDVDTYLRTDEIGRIIEVLQPGVDL